jgi:hypothetical protein
MWIQTLPREVAPRHLTDSMVDPLLFSDGGEVFSAFLQKQVLESHGGIWSAKVDPVSANGPLPNP